MSGGLLTVSFLLLGLAAASTQVGGKEQTAEDLADGFARAQARAASIGNIVTGERAGASHF